MKKLIVTIVLVASCTWQFGCTDFLDVKPIDKLTGNNFYQSQSDVEANINDMYGMLYQKYTSTATAAATGEMRSGVVELNTEPPDVCCNADAGKERYDVIPILAKNDLLAAIDENRLWNEYDLRELTLWDEYYQVIQSANLLIDQLAEGIPALTEKETKRYDAEARFIRNFCYFFMVRLYGDVVYYEKAFQKEALPREGMVSVLNKCIEDLSAVWTALPESFEDPWQKGVRASQGAAIALLMHMNMWNAGFDEVNGGKMYYEATVALGEKLIESNVYRLLPIENFHLVTKGKSDESLFELYYSANYGNSPRNIVHFVEPFIHFPYKQPYYSNQTSFARFKTSYMTSLFPENIGDRRKELWFKGIYSDDFRQFQLLKFAGNIGKTRNEAGLPENTFLIFRYAGVILLQAEALAELGKDGEAIKMLNIVRSRAGTEAYSGPGGKELKDAIFIERAKELIGEGHHYFDLVRTKRILERNWAPNSLTPDQFNRGGWTWPVDRSALNNNPKMTLNNYWLGRSSGI